MRTTDRAGIVAHERLAGSNDLAAPDAGEGIAVEAKAGSVVTPTVHALRDDRYEYVHYHGIWDIDELYDLQEDSGETDLIVSPGHAAIARADERGSVRPAEGDRRSAIPLPRDAGAC